MGAHLLLSGKIPVGTASLSVKWTTQKLSRYCSYLLPKQTGGTTQILIFETLQMIRRPALYTVTELLFWLQQKLGINLIGHPVQFCYMITA